MAERVVNRFERILRAAVGFRLVEADVGQFALDHVDEAAVERLRRRRARVAARVGERDQVEVLAFEVTQNVLQSVLDPPEIASAGTGRGLQALEQIGDALLEMRKRRGAVVADLHAVDAFRQRPHGAFEMFGIVGARRPLATFQVRAQCGDALLQHGKGIPMTFGASQQVDLCRQHLHVVGQPRQRVVGGDVGDDRAKSGDGAFELMHGRRIVIGAQDQVELGMEIADRLVVTRKLLGRRQRAQHLANFGQRAFDAGERVGIGAVVAVLVDTARQRADVVLDRIRSRAAASPR